MQSASGLILTTQKNKQGEQDQDHQHEVQDRSRLFALDGLVYIYIHSLELSCECQSAVNGINIIKF